MISVQKKGMDLRSLLLAGSTVRVRRKTVLIRSHGLLLLGPDIDLDHGARKDAAVERGYRRLRLLSRGVGSAALTLRDRDVLAIARLLQVLLECLAIEGIGHVSEPDLAILLEVSEAAAAFLFALAAALAPPEWLPNRDLPTLAALRTPAALRTAAALDTPALAVTAETHGDCGW